MPDTKMTSGSPAQSQADSSREEMQQLRSRMARASIGDEDTSLSARQMHDAANELRDAIVDKRALPIGGGDFAEARKAALNYVSENRNHIKLVPLSEGKEAVQANTAAQKPHLNKLNEILSDAPYRNGKTIKHTSISLDSLAKAVDRFEKHNLVAMTPEPRTAKSYANAPVDKRDHPMSKRDVLDLATHATMIKGYLIDRVVEISASTSLKDSRASRTSTGIENTKDKMHELMKPYMAEGPEGHEAAVKAMDSIVRNGDRIVAADRNNHAAELDRLVSKVNEKFGREAPSQDYLGQYPQPVRTPSVPQNSEGQRREPNDENQMSQLCLLLSLFWRERR